MNLDPTYRIAPDGYTLIISPEPTRPPSPLTRCAGPIRGASRRILEVQRPAINGRLLASGIAWGETEHKRRWR